MPKNTSSHSNDATIKGDGQNNLSLDIAGLSFGFEKLDHGLVGVNISFGDVGRQFILDSSGHYVGSGVITPVGKVNYATLPDDGFRVGVDADYTEAHYTQQNTEIGSKLDFSFSEQIPSPMVGISDVPIGSSTFVLEKNKDGSVSKVTEEHTGLNKEVVGTTQKAQETLDQVEHDFNQGFSLENIIKSFGGDSSFLPSDLFSDNSSLSSNEQDILLASNGNVPIGKMTPEEQADYDADMAKARENYQNQAAQQQKTTPTQPAESTQDDGFLDASNQDEFTKESLDSINAEEKSNKTIMDASSTTSQGFKQWMSLTTHEDWNDEQWEQQLIGSAIDTTSFAIGESFTTDGMQWTKVNEAFDNNLEGAGTSLVASQIINEGLGLKFGSGLDGQIANAVTTQVVTKTVDAAYQAIQAGQTLSEFGSSVSTNIGNMFYNAEAASQVSQAGNLKELGNVSQIGNLVGGIVGSYAAQQVLNSGTEAEVIGSAIGSTVGTILGSTFLCFLGPLGAAIGSYLGAAIGDTLGEKFNEYSEMDVGEIALDLINPISAVNLVGNFVSAVFGMDEKPPEPEAGVTLEYNPYTGVYEIVSTYEKNGGKTEGIEGASHSLSSSIQDTLNQIAGSGQIANRYDLPKIEVGYIGKHQYIKVNGQDVGKIDSQGMKNTIGTVLKDTVIEGGDTYVNRMVHNDQVSASDILSLVSSAKHLEAYDNDAGLKDFVDQLLNEKQADLATYNDSTAELSAVQQQITQLEKQIEGDQSEQRTTKMQLAMGADDVFEDDLQDIEDTLAAHQQQLSALQAKQTELQSTIDSLFAKDINNPDVGLKQAIEWQTYFNNTQSLNLQNPDVLDDATRLKYEIIHHNQLNADNPDQQFSLFETDMSDLVFEQKDGELTIYNRRGENADTPLSDVPHITIPDWKNWSSTDSNIKLDFTNSDTNEAVEVKSDIHQLMVDVNRLDNSLSGETPDYNLTSENLADKNMTVNIAKTVADINNASGIDMTEQQALDNQFSGFGQQIDSKLSGLNGDDILLANDATAQVDAGSGDDLIVESVAVTDNIGGAGSDTASYILSDEGVSVDLTTGQGHGGYAEGDTFDSIENAVGSHYNDQLIGSDDDNTLSGLEGNDFLSGGAGNDILLGGEGDDVLDGGAGKDHIDGGSGTDTLTFSDQEADGVHVSLNQTSVNGGEADGFANDGKNSDSLGGLENVLGTDGNDRVVGNEANNTLVGKAGDDRLDGMEGDDILSGGEGDDILSGGSGNDTLYGDAGDDILIGGEGDDTLYAGEGSDTLIGGQGNDTAILQGSVEDYALLNTINGSVTLQGPDNEITRLDGIELVAFQQEDGTAVVTDMDTLLERLAQIDKEAREEQEDGGGVRTGMNGAASAAFATSMVAAFSAQAESLRTSEFITQEQAKLMNDNEPGSQSDWADQQMALAQKVDQMNALLGSESYTRDAYQPINLQFQDIDPNSMASGVSSFQAVSSASSINSGQPVYDNGNTLDASSTLQTSVSQTSQITENSLSTTTESSVDTTQTEQTASAPPKTTDALSSGMTATDSTTPESISTATTTFLTPVVLTQAATTLEDNRVALTLNVVGQNPNDETLEIFIANVPTGSSLSAGTLLSDGRYRLLPSELAGLIYYPTKDSDVNVTLDVSVVATSITSGFAQIKHDTLEITLNPIADAPELLANDIVTDEDTPIALQIAAQVTDIDSEAITHYRLENIPANATLSAGEKQADGSWKVMPEEIANLMFNPGHNDSGTLNIHVTAYSQEANDFRQVASTTKTFTLTINPIADAPELIVQNATTDEDTAIGLNVAAQVTDGNSEVISYYTIEDVPDGFSFNNGQKQTDGSWRFTPAEMAAVQLTPKKDFSGTLILKVTGFSEEVSDHTQRARTTKYLGVTINPVVDEPTLEIIAQAPVENVVLGGVVNGAGTYSGSSGSDTIQTGDENDVIYGNGYVHYPLTISSQTNDIDGSESISSTRLTGLPTGTVILDSNHVPLNIENGQYLTDFEVLQNLPVTIAVLTNTGAFNVNVVTQSKESLNSATTEVTQTLSLNTHDQSVGGDTIMAGGGNDQVYASIGNDVVKGELGDDTLYGNKGNDTLYGGAGNDLIYGEDGNDSLVGGVGDNKLYGGAGNDTLYTEGLDSVLDGGDGEDTLVLSDTQASQDLSGIKDIEHIQLNDNVQELKFQGEMDESLFVGQQTGQSHKVKLIGTGTGSENVLKLDIGLQDFLTQLHSGSSAYHLTKNSNGNDELVYEGKYYELEDVARLQFSGGYQGTDTLYLDERNNNLFTFNSSVDLGQSLEDQGLSYNIDNLKSLIQQQVIDVDSGDQLLINSVSSGQNINVTGFDGYTYSMQPSANYYGNANFNVSVKDSVGTAKSLSMNLNVLPVDDNPQIVDVLCKPVSTTSSGKFIEGLLKISDVDGDSSKYFVKDLGTSIHAISYQVNPYWDVMEMSQQLTTQSNAQNVYTDGQYSYIPFAIDLPTNNYGYYATSPSYLLTNYSGDNFLREYINSGIELQNNGVLCSKVQFGVDLNIHITGGDSLGSYSYYFNNTVINGQNYYDLVPNLGAPNTEDNYYWDFTIAPDALYYNKAISNYSTPIVLDLNQNGFDLSSQVSFDFDSDGQKEVGNWLNDSGDAILAYDWNHDGLVNDASEIAFSEYDPNAKTDLEGLALAFDSNHDGVFDAQDEKWKDFGLWKDANLNGQTEEGEFVSMEQAGISSIQLTSDHQQEDGNGYTIFGKGAFTYQDGSEGSFADVALSYEKPAASVSGEPQQATDSVNQDQLDAQLNQLVSAMASNALSANEDVPLPVEETQNHDELLDTAHA